MVHFSVRTISTRDSKSPGRLQVSIRAVTAYRSHRRDSPRLFNQLISLHRVHPILNVKDPAGTHKRINRRQSAWQVGYGCYATISAKWFINLLLAPMGRLVVATIGLASNCHFVGLSVSLTIGSPRLVLYLGTQGNTLLVRRTRAGTREDLVNKGVSDPLRDAILERGRGWSAGVRGNK